jgi:hypothetical protein
MATAPASLAMSKAGRPSSTPGNGLLSARRQHRPGQEVAGPSPSFCESPQFAGPMGRITAEGCPGSWKTCWSAVRRVAAVALGSPVPGLRL